MIDLLVQFFLVILYACIVGGAFCLIEGLVRAAPLVWRWIRDHRPPRSAMRDWRDSSRCLAAYHQRRAEAHR